MPAPPRTVVPFTTRSGLPLDGLSAEMLERVDRFAASRGLSREAAIEHVARVGLEAIEAGAPLAPLEPPANDAPRRSR